MTKEAFVDKMKAILEKAGDAADICMTWHSVSDDPDCIADFGMDEEGNLRFIEQVIPIAVSDLTGIRYRVVEDGPWYIRFEFGDNYLNYYFDYCNDGEMFDLKYNGFHYNEINMERVLEVLKA